MQKSLMSGSEIRLKRNGMFLIVSSNEKPIRIETSSFDESKGKSTMGIISSKEESRNKNIEDVEGGNLQWEVRCVVAIRSLTSNHDPRIECVNILNELLVVLYIN